MTRLIYYRIFGNAVALSLHSVNSIVMLSSFQDEMALKDPDIRNLSIMQSRYFTIWNFTFQMIYAALALTCDVLTVMKREHLLTKPIKKSRDIIFSTFVFPGTLFVFSMFWPIYLLDRSLIYPTYMDRVISPKSNYVMHFAILPFALWEFMFQPRVKPKAHAPLVAVVIAIYIVYNTHIQMTYNMLGLWPYPLFYKIYGTIYHVIFHIFIFTWSISCYYLQWPVHTLIWGNDKKISEKSS